MMERHGMSRAEAREMRVERMRERQVDEYMETMLSAKDVGPRARAKLRPLVAHYMKKPKPFTACVRDNRKRFGPGAEAVCAVIKDIGMGTTKWRKGRKGDLSASYEELMPEYGEIELTTEQIQMIEALTEEDIQSIIESSADLPEEGILIEEEAPQASVTGEVVDSPATPDAVAAPEAAGGDTAAGGAELSSGMEGQIAEFLDKIAEAASAGDTGKLSKMFTRGTWPASWDSDISEMLYENQDEKLETMRMVVSAVRDSEGAPLDENFFSELLGKEEEDAEELELSAAGDGSFFVKGDGQEWHIRGAEIMLSSPTIAEKKGKHPVFRKQMLKTGTIRAWPDAFGRPVKKEVKIIEGHADDGQEDVIGLADIKQSFDEKVFDQFTVPLEHPRRDEDDVTKNTGFIRSLSIEQDPRDPETKVLVGDLEILDEEAADKIRTGLYANGSLGLRFNFPNRETGETYRTAIDHFAITNKNWIPNLETFEPATQLSANGIVEGNQDVVAPFVLDEKEKRDADIGGDLSVENNDTQNDDVQAATTGMDGTQIEELRTNLSAAQEREKKMQEELERLRERDHERDVKERIANLSSTGLKNFPGFLRTAEALMRSDDGAPVTGTVNLSVGQEDGTEKSEELNDITLTEAVDALAKSLLSEESMVSLSAQVERVEGEGADTGRPENETRNDKYDYDPASVAERAAAMRADLGVPAVGSAPEAGKE
jgi:hypothetical protein